MAYDTQCRVSDPFILNLTWSETQSFISSFINKFMENGLNVIKKCFGVNNVINRTEKKSQLLSCSHMQMCTRRWLHVPHESKYVRNFRAVRRPLFLFFRVCKQCFSTKVFNSIENDKHYFKWILTCKTSAFQLMVFISGSRGTACSELRLI